MTDKKIYPFSAIVGQEQMKTALILNVVNPRLGGVLIRGEKGTAKSTAVRALAEVLPDTRVVDLPVSATEDRVAGTLDIEYALQHGEKRFEPGILAQADQNILYVDEVNLLDDHIVDIPVSYTHLFRAFYFSPHNGRTASGPCVVFCVKRLRWFGRRMKSSPGLGRGEGQKI